MRYKTRSPEETKRVATEFARTLRGGDVVRLEGELGAGKTVFVQGMCEALGTETYAHSPTFTLVNIYRVSSGSISRIVHMDFYRVPTESERRSLGLEDLLGQSDTIACIEWPSEELPVPLNARIRTVRLRRLDSDQREIVIE